MRGICDDGIACEQSHQTILNEYGSCPDCEEQRNYEDEKFPFTDGSEKELRGLLQEVLDNADEADLDNEVYLDIEIINRIKEMIENEGGDSA